MSSANEATPLLDIEAGPDDMKQEADEVVQEEKSVVSKLMSIVSILVSAASVLSFSVIIFNQINPVSGKDNAQSIPMQRLVVAIACFIGINSELKLNKRFTVIFSPVLTTWFSRGLLMLLMAIIAAQDNMAGGIDEDGSFGKMVLGFTGPVLYFSGFVYVIFAFLRFQEPERVYESTWTEPEFVPPIPGKPDNSTSALINSFVPLIVPTIRRTISKEVVTQGIVLRNEKPVESWDENQPDEMLPIGEIKVSYKDILVMDSQSIKNDMEAAPEYAWPEKDHIVEMMEVTPGSGSKMVVLDIVEFRCEIPFGEGIEFKFPQEIPVIGKANFEVGRGNLPGSPFFRFLFPKIRVWIVPTKQKAYVGLMGRTQLYPNIHINADKGKGDFMDIEFTEEGRLDDVIEEVLAGLGPKSFTKEVVQKEKASKQWFVSRSADWIADAIGSKISSIVQGSMGNVKGNGPIEIDLSSSVEDPEADPEVVSEEDEEN